MLYIPFYLYTLMKNGSSLPVPLMNHLLEAKKRFQCNVYKCKDHTIFYEEMRANSSQNNLNELYRMCQQFVITADQCYSVLLSLIGHIARSINVHVGNALTHNSPYLFIKNVYQTHAFNEMQTNVCPSMLTHSPVRLHKNL